MRAHGLTSFPRDMYCKAILTLLFSLVTARLACGAEAVDRVEGEPLVARRLMELGLVPGTHVEVVRRAPLGDPIELRLRQVHLSIRRSEAAHIHVTTD